MIDLPRFRLLAPLAPLVFALAGASLLPMNALAQEQCPDEGVVFGFFNGVNTTHAAGTEALNQLQRLYGSTTPAGQALGYDLYYNDTDGLTDFAETFEQRLREHDAVLADRFELFFSAVNGQRGDGWWDALTAAVPALGDVLVGLIDTVMANAAQQLTRLLNQPNLAEVSQRHREQTERWAAQDRKLLFFAHSQGNLYVNTAYAHALTQTDAASVRVVHVAPASPTLSGRHTLADRDLVINGLRATGMVAPNTDTIPPFFLRDPGSNGKRDVLGHGLLEIYLNAALSTSRHLATDVRAALLELDQAPKQPLRPFPEFVPMPFAGGPAPTLVPGEASHVLTRIEVSDSIPWVFVKQHPGAGWAYRRDVQPGVQAPGSMLTTYIGNGMGGFERCDWDWVHMDGWEGLQYQQECVRERVPLHSSTGNVVAELAAYADAPAGTQVRLNKMTWTNPQLQFGSGVGGRIEVRLTSAVRHAGFSQYSDVVETVEPYVMGTATSASRAEYEAWQALLLAHEQSEAKRFADYEAQRKAHEDRRACRGA